MRIALVQEELKIIMLHMAIMRKSVKKGFKKRYSAFESKLYIKTYDETLRLLSDKFEVADSDIELNEQQYELLVSFLAFYVPELGKDEKNLDKDQKEQLEILKSIEQKITLLEVKNNE